MVINLIKKKGINPQTRQTIFYPKWTRRSTDTAMELAEDKGGQDATNALNEFIDGIK